MNIDIFGKKKVKELEREIRIVRDELERTIGERNLSKSCINELNFNNKRLYDENQKLIEWIQKILEQFGTMEVSDRHSVTIPIYKQETSVYTPTENEFGIAKMKQKEYITIPEITIYKMGW